MPESTMWQGVVTTTCIDKERQACSTLLIIVDKTGLAHPDPNAAWSDAQEMLEEACREKKKGEAVSACIRPAGYRSEGDDPKSNIVRKPN